MRHRLPGLLALGLALSLSSAALAGDKKSAKGSDDRKAQSGERKDPDGVTGISPFMELINKGNAAYVARDYATAATKYQEAIQKKTNHPLGHYMLGQAYLAEKKFDDADRAWQSALRFAQKAPVLRAKVLLVIADLREQQGRWDDAEVAWKAYADFVGANPNAKGYAATPTSRQSAIEKRKSLATKYATVKERITQREMDAASKAKE